MASFAALGQIVSLRSRSLAAAVYLVDPAAAGLGEAGTPRHRCYLPGELTEVTALFTLKPSARAAALRALDALREIFGDLDVVKVTPAPAPAQLALGGPAVVP